LQLLVSGVRTTTLLYFGEIENGFVIMASTLFKVQDDLQKKIQVNVSYSPTPFYFSVFPILRKR